MEKSQQLLNTVCAVNWISMIALWPLYYSMNTIKNLFKVDSKSIPNLFQLITLITILKKRKLLLNKIIVKLSIHNKYVLRNKDTKTNR